jgi:AcrR family transcriptional regulator
MNKIRSPEHRVGAVAHGRRGVDGDRTRADLLAAGRSLFARRGYDGASIRAITHAADANLVAVTYHFGSKEALYGAVLEAGLRPLVARVSAAADAGGTALDRLCGVVEAYFEHLREHPDVPRLLLQ